MMGPDDLIEISGYLFGAYGVGFASGYLIRAFHKLGDFLR